MNLLPKIFPISEQQRRERAESEMLRREAEIGGQLFGPIPKGHRRSFFCLDQHTWIWHEEWLQNGQRRAITTRYEVRPNGVLKLQDGQVYQRLSKDEARNLYRAAKLYVQRMRLEYQSPQTAS